VVEPSIVCPKCGHRFPLTKALTAQIEEPLREKFEVEGRERERAAQAAYEKRLTAERAKLEREATAAARKASAAELSKLRASLAAADSREKAAQAKFECQLASEKARLKAEALKEAAASVSAKVAELRRKVEEKEAQLRQIQHKEAELHKRESALRAKEQGLQRRIAEEVSAARTKAAQEATAKADKEHRTRELQHQKVVTDLKSQLTEARRRLEQASQQAQGEVIELEIERVLSAAFPDDKVKPIAKGRLGADIIQRVLSPSGQHCGTIIWESKNTKSWSRSWLSKLRSDQRREKAEIAVLVSSALPKDLRAGFGQLDGVWITDFALVPGVAAALRANLIDVARVRGTARGQPEKMEILYRYLMSTEFRQRVEAIVEAFKTMKDDLDRERQAAQKNWAKREKSLELILQNVSGMVGDIQAINPAFPKIRRLELPASR